MKVAIMQPYFLPYIGYFQLINEVDQFIILDDVNYIKKGWINRNRIIGNNGDFLFTLPIEKVSQNIKINELQIVNDNYFKMNFQKQISHTYSKAPNYYVGNQLIKETLSYEELNLSKYLKYSIEQICELLNIKTKLRFSSYLKIDKNKKREEKILDICKSLKASIYINPIGGTEIYSKEYFEANSIKLQFINTTTIEYPQFNNKFIPSLSIIDVIMFNEIQRVIEYLNKFEIV